MRFHRFVAAAGIAFCLAASPAIAGSFYVTTGTGSGEVTIDANTPFSLTYIGGGSFSQFEGGVFAMKHAPGTTFGIQLDLIDINTVVIGTASFNTIADFVTSGGGTSYARIVFDVPGVGVSLSSGDTYEVRFSVVGDPLTETGSYSIQGTVDSLALVETEDPNSIEVAAQPAVTTTPEPAAALVFATGLVGLLRARRTVRPASA